MEKLLLFAVLLTLAGCIGDDIVDDFVPPAMKITNPVDTLGLGETWQFEAMFTNNIGREEALPVIWSANKPDVLSMSAAGLATGVAKGTATVAAEVNYNGELVRAELEVVVAEETVVSPNSKSGDIKTTSSYELKGSFVITTEGNGIKISVADDYKASTALPGLYVYLGNNPNSIADALEISMVQIYSGAHSYLVEGVGLNDYSHILYWCKPFNVKVGEGEIK